MEGIYDESYILNSQDSDFSIYERKFENLTSETVFTHMHFHRDFEILYVTNGCAQMQVADKKFEATPESVVLINPYEPHYGRIAGKDFGYLCIDFNFALLNFLSDKNRTESRPRYLNHIQNAEEILPYLLGCYNAIKDGLGDWKMRAAGNLLLFFSCLSDYKNSTDSSEEYIFTKKALEMLEENYSGKLNTQIMAEAFSYNESYFCRKFQKAFNCSFSEYLKLYRVSRAKEILKHKSVTETAMETGFSGDQYFSRIFKEITGMSPLQYKKHSV